MPCLVMSLVTRYGIWSNEKNAARGQDKRQAGHMRIPFIVFGLFFALLPNWAAASGCSTIHDDDMRHRCYAREDKSSGWCNMIHDDDERQLCYAEQEKHQ
ncbi:hypothetical protein DYH55_18580 [Methylovirgula sp. 4M-Z18]|nr:hypothetical protein DYH55_18580 [Methylovirgula sp. 4M-Z18]